MRKFKQISMFDELNEYEQNGHHENHDNISAAGMQSEAVLASSNTQKNSPAIASPSPAGNEALKTIQDAMNLDTWEEIPIDVYMPAYGISRHKEALNTPITNDYSPVGGRLREINDFRNKYRDWRVTPKKH